MKAVLLMDEERGRTDAPGLASPAPAMFWAAGSDDSPRWPMAWRTPILDWIASTNRGPPPGCPMTSLMRPLEGTLYHCDVASGVSQEVRRLLPRRGSCSPFTGGEEKEQ